MPKEIIQPGNPFANMKNVCPLLSKPVLAQGQVIFLPGPCIGRACIACQPVEPAVPEGKIRLSCRAFSEIIFLDLEE